MFLAKILFRLKPSRLDGREGDRDELQEVAEGYLCMLLKNWQLYGNYQFVWNEDCLSTYSYMPRPDAIAPKYHSQWGKEHYQKVIDVFGQPPTYKVLNDEVPDAFPTWQESSFFYLFTHLLAIEGPLSCGDTGESVPLYDLPISNLLRDRLSSWASSYQAHDQVYIDSGTLEIPAYKQMADPNSELSKMGRDLCAEIEAATGKPTYYYLHRYWTHEVGEENRLCPLCGGEWCRLESDRTRFYQFDFRCDRPSSSTDCGCRIVSHKGTETHSEYALIGE